MRARLRVALVLLALLAGSAGSAEARWGRYSSSRSRNSASSRFFAQHPVAEAVFIILGIVLAGAGRGRYHGSSYVVRGRHRW